MSSDVRSDAELLERWRGGDTRAGQILFERHYAALDRFFRNKAGEDCQELLQRSFLACLEKRDTLRNAASFRAFLFGIARFELLRYINERRWDPEAIDPSRMSLCNAQTSPSHIVAQRRQQHRLAEALPRIPLDLQIIVELHYWEGLSTTEVAEVVGIPPGTVKSRLRRAKQLLLTEMAALGAAAIAGGSGVASFDSWAVALGARP